MYIQAKRAPLCFFLRIPLECNGAHESAPHWKLLFYHSTLNTYPSARFYSHTKIHNMYTANLMQIPHVLNRTFCSTYSRRSQNRPCSCKCQHYHANCAYGNYEGVSLLFSNVLHCLQGHFAQRFIVTKTATNTQHCRHVKCSWAMFS